MMTQVLAVLTTEDVKEYKIFKEVRQAVSYGPEGLRTVITALFQIPVVLINMNSTSSHRNSCQVLIYNWPWGNRDANRAHKAIIYQPTETERDRKGTWKEQYELVLEPGAFTRAKQYVVQNVVSSTMLSFLLKIFLFSFLHLKSPPNISLGFCARHSR